MKFLSFIFLLLNSCFSNEQSTKYSEDFSVFKKYIFSVFEDTTNYWQEYPKPPKITDAVVAGILKEIEGSDSAQYFLNKLSSSQLKSHVEIDSFFNYINRNDFEYSLIASAAHWNPDVRVLALHALNKKLTARPLTNSVKMKNGEWAKFDSVAIEFLTYLLEGTSLFISGSENATIHGIYLSNILWNLDLLTKEKIADKKQFGEWYKNDLQFETAILRWRSHIK